MEIIGDGMNNIKVSVIIPVFNMQYYLAECLNSVLNQSLVDIEIITINDGSTDDSLEILKNYSKEDNRIVLIDKKNEGVWAARNDGIKCAKGEYISFLDSDDLYSDQDVLGKLYNAAIENNVCIAGGRRERLYEDGRIVKEKKTAKCEGVEFLASGLSLYQDYQYDYGYTCYIYNRELLINNSIFFPPYSRFQDPPFFVKAMFAAKSFYMVDDYVYRYRYLPKEEKYTWKKTIDQLQGVMDNLLFSKENNLSKLHFVSAVRLDTESSYMASKNVDSPHIEEILRKMIEANALVDQGWLIQENLPIKRPFISEFFRYLLKATNKYEKLRNKKALKAFRKIFKQ